MYCIAVVIVLPHVLLILVGELRLTCVGCACAIDSDDSGSSSSGIGSSRRGHSDFPHSGYSTLHLEATRMSELLKDY